ncbi:MAG: class I SAM-dependent methyltransferase [Clostridia bacterium]|nr:class I SAM-dependent methyltransferase [Clostridia bacterium]
MYNDFAKVYDKLQDADYEAFIDFYERIFEKMGKKPKLVLDLGCGTGNITIPMAKRGYDMIGLDLSCEMLNIAHNKAAHEGADILFLNQDMREMELYGTVDAMVCALDGFNYITEPDDLKQVMKLVENYLNPGGIMIFDISTVYKLREILGGNTYVSDEDDIYYVWQSEFFEEEKICEFELNFFCRQEDGNYLRFDEYQTQRAYSPDEITEIAEGVGLDVTGIYKPFEFLTFSENDERIFFVISKKSY